MRVWTSRGILYGHCWTILNGVMDSLSVLAWFMWITSMDWQGIQKTRQFGLWIFSNRRPLNSHPRDKSQSRKNMKLAKKLDLNDVFRGVLYPWLSFPVSCFHVVCCYGVFSSLIKYWTVCFHPILIKGGLPHCVAHCCIFYLACFPNNIIFIANLSLSLLIQFFLFLFFNKPTLLCLQWEGD